MINKSSSAYRTPRVIQRASLQRLRSSIYSFEPELETLLDEARRDRPTKDLDNWERRLRTLVDRAKEALESRDADTGWRFLKVADRQSFYGLSDDELRNEAALILIEASAEAKGVSKWRTDCIRALLEESDGKLLPTLRSHSVVRAKRTLDEHYDNIYHKMKILKSRLSILSSVSVIAVVFWIVFLPFRPKVLSIASEHPNDVIPQRWLWVGIVSLGILGALVSGFFSSMAAGKARMKIPAELSATHVTFARLSLAMVAAIAISVFLLGEVLKIPMPSYEIMLTAAFIAGFTDRLLVKAINSVVSAS